jgi:hypothetical protein
MGGSTTQILITLVSLEETSSLQASRCPMIPFLRSLPASPHPTLAILNNIIKGKLRNENGPDINIRHMNNRK